MGEKEVGEYLSYLALKRNVSASTQNQALNALNFVYKAVLDRPLQELNGVVRAKGKQKFTRCVYQKRGECCFKGA